MHLEDDVGARRDKLGRVPNGEDLGLRSGHILAKILGSRAFFGSIRALDSLLRARDRGAVLVSSMRNGDEALTVLGLFHVVGIRRPYEYDDVMPHRPVGGPGLG